MIFAITPERGRALALGFILVSLSAPASAAMLIYEALQRAAERDPTYLAAFAHSVPTANGASRIGAACGRPWVPSALPS